MDALNVEIKARCPYVDSIRQELISRNALYVGLDHQVDTYFKVPKGRLKLRNGTIEKALIYYQRPDLEGPKRSEVKIHKLTEGDGLNDILSHALNVLTVVDKKREIYFIDNVKFHIDQVDQLGSFIEIEAIAEEQQSIEFARDVQPILQAR